MKLKLPSSVLFGLTIAYGVVIAILGALGSEAVGMVAFIGALIVGGLWAVRGVLEDRERRSSS
ncbi:MAG: hypothetical protein GEU81_13020 [Nitriliruptorales bacterium]|nr:hypothetical protein [Nitriliruptorales bacterium]